MVLKSIANTLSTIAVVPALASFRIRAALIGRERAFAATVQTLSLLPGLPGQYLRRAFLRFVVPHCHRTAVIAFGTLLSDPDAVFEANVYVGPHCDLGRVHIEHDAIIAAGTHIPSGPHTHGTEDLSTPMRDQPGARVLVRVGAGAWIGNNAIVMADIGHDAVVAAGAVVTKPVPPYAVVAGIPAKVIRFRGGSAAPANART